MAGHAFISYVREDSAVVDRIQAVLEGAGIPVWRDIKDIGLGLDWRREIEQAITEDTLVFIACFSETSTAKEVTWQREELTLAVEQYRQRRPDRPWLIPVRLDDCAVPDIRLGAGTTLGSLNRLDLFDDRWDDSATRLVTEIHRLLPDVDPPPRRPARSPAPVAGPALAPVPFVFGGVAVDDPAALGRALSERWEPARRLLAERSDEDNAHSRLLTWLADHGPDRAVRAAKEPGPVDRRLARLIVALAPDAPPRFEGHELDDGRLRAWARRAGLDGDAEAAALLSRLYEADVLGCHQRFAATDTCWRRAVAGCARSFQRLPRPVRVGHKGPGHPALGLTLLGCLGGSEEIAALARTAAALADELAVPWFHDHLVRTEADDGRDPIAADTTTILLAGIAAEVREDELLRLQQARWRDLRIAAGLLVVALVHMVGLGFAGSTWGEADNPWNGFFAVMPWNWKPPIGEEALVAMYFLLWLLVLLAEATHEPSSE